jgi:hypothetical protein
MSRSFVAIVAIVAVVMTVAACQRPNVVSPAPVPAAAPTTPPHALLHPSRIIRPDSIGVRVFADLIEVQFREGASLAERAAAIASVEGTVVGGFAGSDGREGIYSVLLPHDTTGVLMLRAVRSLRARASVRLARYELVPGVDLAPPQTRPPQRGDEEASQQ